MDQEVHIARIDSYLSGRMMADEKRDFENELAGDPQLNQLFKEHKYFIDGIEGMKADQFVKSLRDLSASSGKTTRIWMNWSYISVAAIILLLVGMYFIFTTASMQRLANEYYSAPLAQIQRSSIPDENRSIEKGMRAYADGDWKAAIANFTQIKEDNPLYQRSQYYTAHSYAALKEFEIALELFQQPVLSQGQYQHPSEWTAVIMKMFLKYPREEVIRDLTRIANQPGHYYSEKAMQLIEKIQKKRIQ